MAGSPGRQWLRRRCRIQMQPSTPCVWPAVAFSSSTTRRRREETNWKSLRQRTDGRGVPLPCSRIRPATITIPRPFKAVTASCTSPTPGKANESNTSSSTRHGFSRRSRVLRRTRPTSVRTRTGTHCVARRRPDTFPTMTSPRFGRTPARSARPRERDPGARRRHLAQTTAAGNPAAL